MQILLTSLRFFFSSVKRQRRASGCFGLKVVPLFVKYCRKIMKIDSVFFTATKNVGFRLKAIERFFLYSFAWVLVNVEVAAAFIPTYFKHH